MKKANISQVDTIFANGSYPIEFLLYYKSNLNTQKIRAALKQLAPAFWPVFGKYAAGIIEFDKYIEEDCFDERAFDQEFDCKATHQQIYETFGRINPAEMRRLFFLTVMHYRNGTVLIPKLNHLAGDGYSYFYFLSALAAMCQDSHVPFKKYFIRAFYKPQHQRTVLKEFQLENIELKPLRQDEKLTIVFEEIPKATAKQIIKHIASQLKQQVSTNDLLSAMIIKRTAEVQAGYFGENFQLTIPIDVRKYIKEYGPRYFGNGIMFHTVNFKTAQIEQSSVQDLAIEIRKSMPVVTKEHFIKFLITLENLIAKRQVDKLRPYAAEQGCLVTNLSKLPVTGLNFGTGNPDSIFTLTIGKNSAVILADEKNFILRIVY